MKVKVLGHDVSVVRKDLKEDNILGRFSSEPVLLIELEISMYDTQSRRVLLHEMIHAALYVSGLAAGMSVDLNEQITLMFEYEAEKLLKESKKGK